MSDHRRRGERPLRLAYLMSLRNSTADQAGRMIEYRGGSRYMKSPLEFTVELIGTSLKDLYSLETIIFDDDPDNGADVKAVGDYGLSPRTGAPWIFPPGLAVAGDTRAMDLMRNIPSTYRSLPRADVRRPSKKLQFEHAVLAELRRVKADVVLVDGLLLILDALIGIGSPYHRRVINIHPGITCEGSCYQRRGLYATKDALWGARGKQVTDWQRMEMRDVSRVMMTGASLHYVDHGIDSGEVIHEVLNTHIRPEDTLHELRWNNFHDSVFPALDQGLRIFAERTAPIATDQALAAEALQ